MSQSVKPRVNFFYLNFFLHLYLFVFNILCIHASCVLLAAAHDTDSRYLTAEEQSRELTRSIRREVGKLSEQWNNLIDKSDNWKHRLDEYMTVSFTRFYYFTTKREKG